MDLTKNWKDIGDQVDSNVARGKENPSLVFILIMITMMLVMMMIRMLLVMMMIMMTAEYMVALAWSSNNPLDISPWLLFQLVRKFSAISPFADSER